MNSKYATKPGPNSHMTVHLRDWGNKPRNPHPDDVKRGEIRREIEERLMQLELNTTAAEVWD